MKNNYAGSVGHSPCRSLLKIMSAAFLLAAITAMLPSKAYAHAGNLDPTVIHALD